MTYTLGEIRIFAGNFAPAGWAFCDGALLPIAENETLFNLIGTTYGGDGQATFALPDLRGRVPMHQGESAGQTRTLGERGGVEQVTLTPPELPQHSHALLASTRAGTANRPESNVLAAGKYRYVEDVVTTGLSPSAVSPVGGGQPHDNMQPTMAINYIISLYGIYPAQS